MKPKKLKLIQWLDTGIIWPKIMFSQGMTYQEIHKHFTRTKIRDPWLIALEHNKDIIESPAWCAVRTIVTQKNKKAVCFFICIKGYFDFTDYDYCRLAHEVQHIINYVMPDFCDIIREHEFCAYMHTHIMKQCLNKIRGK